MTRGDARGGSKPIGAKRGRGTTGLTRDEVLRAAARLFAERGYEGTTLGAIGTALGVSGPALYYYFSSKEEMLYEFFATENQRLADLLAAATAEGTATERLRSGARALVLYYVRELAGSGNKAPPMYSFYHLTQSLSPRLARRVRDLERAHIGRLRELIQEAIDGGEIPAVEVTAAAFAIEGIAEHAPYWFRPTRGLSESDLADLYATFVLRLLGVRDAELLVT